MNDALAWFLGLALLGAYVLSSLRAREAVLARTRTGCESLRVQLLDDTVAQRRLRPARSAAGRLCWRREYRFEFSITGADRRRGNAVVLGDRVEFVRLEMPDGPVIVDGARTVERLH